MLANVRCYASAVVNGIHTSRTATCNVPIEVCVTFVLTARDYTVSWSTLKAHFYINVDGDRSVCYCISARSAIDECTGRRQWCNNCTMPCQISAEFPLQIPITILFRHNYRPPRNKNKSMNFNKHDSAITAPNLT